MQRANYHTHTCLCKHATGAPSDYCHYALASGMTTLGFSDHTPHPDGRWDAVRMSVDQLPLYVQQVRQAQKDFPELQIYLGMECEYVEGSLAFFRDELLGRHRFDYLVGAVHNYPYKGEWMGIFGVPMSADQLHAYTDHLIQLIGSGLFAFIAHPDLFGLSYMGWDAETQACSKAIIEAAIQYDIPLEINGYGMRKRMVQDHGEWRFPYPLLPFWELAGELQPKAITNSDAHQPIDVWGNRNDCLNLAKHCGLTLIECLADNPPNSP